jgi:hypothetical protein
MWFRDAREMLDGADDSLIALLFPGQIDRILDRHFDNSRLVAKGECGENRRTGQVT